MRKRERCNYVPPIQTPYEKCVWGMGVWRERERTLSVWVSILATVSPSPNLSLGVMATSGG